MTKLFAKEKQPQPTRGLKTMRLFTATGGQTQELIIPTNIIIRRCLRFALVTNYKVKSIRTSNCCEEHVADMAQNTCPVRAKNLMALSYAALRGPSVYANVKHRLHYARHLLICLQSVLHHTCLRTASDAVIRIQCSWHASLALLSKQLCDHYTLLSL